MLGSLFGRVFFLVVSIVVIVIGAVLTVTLVFSFIGIPLLVIGIILLLISLMSLVFGTFGDLLFLLRRPAKKHYVEKKKGETIIEVEEKDGVYSQKKKAF